jgi:SAM-dependent methyltransferase
MNYSDYLDLQKKKTTDPIRRSKWLNEEWGLKLGGFSRIFAQNQEYAQGKSLCIGARTGQEVQALIDQGNEAVGIDLVAQKPLVLEGDFHDLDFEDSVFDFVFSNVVDHALYPDKFCSEMVRVLKPKGFALIHLQVNVPDDEYGVHEITDLESGFMQYLPTNTRLVKNVSISHSEFATFNREVVIQKTA